MDPKQYRSYECQACLRWQVQPARLKPRRYCKRCGYSLGRNRAGNVEMVYESNGLPEHMSDYLPTEVTVWPKGSRVGSSR